MRSDDTLEALHKLQALIPEPQEAQGLVMLLGSGIGAAMADVRARQAALESIRADVSGSAAAGGRRAEAEAAGAAVTALQEQVRRLRVTEPRAGEGVVGVYGHVLQEGEPVAGAQVALVDGDRRLACVDTDRSGSFALSMESARALGLMVTVDSRVVYRDREATVMPGPVATYRLIELDDSSAPPPTQHPCDDDGQQRSGPLPEAGGSLTQTLKDLTGSGVRVAKVRVSPSDDATARVVDVREAEDGVELDVRGRLTDAGRLAVVASVLAHQPHAERAGIGSAAAAKALLKAAGVTTWAEAEQAATMPLAGLERAFAVDHARAVALRTALAATMSAIEIEDRG